MKRCYTAFVLSAAVAMHPLPAAVSAQTEEMPIAKTFLDTSMLVNKEDKDGNTVISGWDLNESGGRVLPYAGIQMNDTSPDFPVEAVRVIDEVTFGEVTIEFRVSLNQTMPGAAIRFADGFTDSFAFVFEQDGLYMCGNGGAKLFLSRVTPNTDLGIKAVIDFDNKKAAVYANGVETFKNVGFTPQALINRIIVSSGEKAVGNFTLKNIRVHRGYAMNEYFTASGGRFSQDWNITAPGGTASPRLDTSAGEITLTKQFAPQRGVLVLDFQIRLVKKRGGVSFALSSGNTPVLTIEARNDGYFYCAPNIRLVEYSEDMWQHFRVRLDTASHRADVRINGKLVQTGVATTNAAFVDAFTLFAAQSADTPVFAEDFLLYSEEPITDYPPAPVKVNSNGVAIGMQSCPLWTEGRHFGYDWINSAEPRVPLLGFYDESSPEAVDWEMKFMAEHGIDFQWICWYMSVGAGKPIKGTDVLPYIHNGYFNARYSDDVKFAILWENAANYPWTGDKAYNREMFFKYVAPFWIEYYFKDPRYFKSNGRPLLGIYRLGELRSAFGTEFSELGAFMAQFKQMCVDAGVGAPFVILQEYPDVDFGNEGAHYALQTQMKFDAFYNYSYSSNGWPQTQKAAQILGRDKASLLRFIPTYSVGFDTAAWDGSPGVSLSPRQFEDMLRDGRDNFLPTLSYAGLSERILILGTWNEYGEGHAIMPSAGNGFGYLDAVKNVFAPGVHTDTVPNDDQKDRINTAYPKGRRVSLREREVSAQIPQDNDVTRSWSFDGNAEGWSGAVWEGGCLKVSSATQIDGLDINATDISYIRLRLKNQSGAPAVNLSYATNFYPVLSGGRTLTAYIGEQSGNFIDVVVPVSKYPALWRGNVKSLRLAFDNVASGQNILIDSVELLATPRKCYELNLDGIRLESSAVLHGGTLYLPFVEAHGILGFKYCTRSDGSMLFKGKNGVTVETGANGGVYPERCTWIEESGSLYLSAELFALLTSRTVMWDGQTLFVSGEEVIEPAPPSMGNPWNSVFSYEFNNTSVYDFYHYGDGFTGNSVTDGYWRISKKTGAHAFLYMNNIAVPAGNVKRVELAVRATGTVGGGIYYQTSASPGEAESKKLGFSIPGDEKFRRFSFNTSGLTGWSGNITKLRLDLTGGAADSEIQIAYIRLIGETPAFAAPFDCVSLETNTHAAYSLATATVNGLQNNSAAEEVVRLYLASYNDGVLTDARFKDIPIAPRDFIPRERLWLRYCEPTSDIKAFLWTEALMPVTQSLNFR